MADGIQWGTQRFQGNTQPNWNVDLTTDPTGDTIDTGGHGGSGALGHVARGYNANNVVYGRPNHPIAGENLEATDRGWERVVHYTDQHGNGRFKREVVVAQGGLANTLAYGTSGEELLRVTSGGPKIVDIRWTTANNETGPSGAAGGDGYLYAIGDTVGVQVTYSEPVYVNAAGGIPVISITSSTGGGESLSAELTSGNNTNKLVFTNTETKTAAEILSLTDSSTFIAITGGVLSGMQANTGYGRVANTPYPELFRTANVSSFGVFGLQAGDATVGGASLTLAADAGVRKVKTE